MSAVEIAVEVAGWAGALLILLAYLLLSAGRLTGVPGAKRATMLLESRIPFRKSKTNAKIITIMSS